MGADALALWANFFVAEVGAAAALAGLLFVAVSINLERVLEIKQLPPQALSALLSFLSVLLVGTIGLVPRLGLRGTGVGFAFAGLVTLTGQVLTLRRTMAYARQHGFAGFWVAQATLPSLSFIAAGVMMWGGSTAALIGLLPGVVLSFGAGVLGAWVLLIEIKR